MKCVVLQSCAIVRNHFAAYCVCAYVNELTTGLAMKRRTERTLHSDLNRIVRRKGRRTPSPPPVDTRRREVRDNSLYERSAGKSSDDRILRPPIERLHYPKEQAGPSSGQGRPFAEKFEFSLRLTNLDYNRPDLEVKEALFKEFKKFGFINVKVLGFGKDRHAFVNFAREAGARRARRDMQEHVLFGRPIHLEWSKTTLAKFAELNADPPKRRSVSREESPVYNDYPHKKRGGGGGGDDFSDHELRDLNYWGSHNRHHQSPVPSLPEPPRSTVVEPNATRTLFVGNLEADITEKELRDLFGPYGRIEAIDIKMQRSAGTAYAFVKFVTINDAMNAKSDMHSRQYGEFRLKIGFGKGSPTAKVWLGNLTSYADLSEIRHELDRFGLIRRVDYNDGDNHAFIHFDSLDAAQTAVNSLTGYRFKTTKLPLKIDLSRYSHVRSDFDDMDIGDWQERGPQPSHDKRPSVLPEDMSYKKKLREREQRFRGDANGKQTPPPTPSHYRGNKQDEHVGNAQGRGGGALERPIRRKRPRTPPLPPPVDLHENTHKHRQSSIDSQSGGDHAYRSKRPKSSAGGDRERGGDHINSNDKSHGSSSHEPKKTPPSEHRQRHSSVADDRKSADKPKTSHALVEAPPTVTDLAAADTALKLSDTTEPISPDSTKSVKPDSGSPETLTDLAKLYPVAWRGNLVLKNTGFPTRMHLVGGDPAVAETLLCGKDKEDSCTLRITQRLRLEPPRLEEVNKRMTTAGPGGHCVMLALPGPTPSQSSPEHTGDSSMQLRPLRSLVSYLKQKEAAGIVALSPNDAVDSIVTEKDLSKDVIGVLHAFPPCLFSQQQLLKIAPNLGSEPSKEDHIVVLLVKGTV